MEAKSKWKSKTMWFNWLVSVVVVVAATAQTYLPDMGLSSEASAQIMFALVLLVTFGNKYLRSITGGPVK
jgi:hypothetical protein